MERPRHIDWMVEEVCITIKNGNQIKYYNIGYKKDNMTLDDWAL